jgi:hypothetical protein
MKLTKISQNMLSYFIKNNCLKEKHQSAKVDKIVLKLYDDIKEAYIYLSNSKKTYNPTIKKIVSSHQIPKGKLFSYDSFPKKIIQHIEQKTTFVISYDFSLFERKIKLVFAVEDSDAQLNIETYNEYVDHIIMWLYIINKYASKRCSQTFTTYFYFSSLEKKLPDNPGEILEQTHINTAFTTTCPVDSEIIIFRREEWFKVFMHETFHNFAFDFSDMDTNLCHQIILGFFPVKSEVNLYEAYTEFWAELINCLMCSFFSLKDKNDEEEFLENAEFLINLERTFSFFQMTKALNFMGLSYKDLISKTKGSAILRDEKYNEKTNVLAYYVIKTIILENYQNFLLWCDKNNVSLLQFKKTVESQVEFCKFIEKYYKSKSMLDSVKCAEEFFEKKNKSKSVDQTLHFINKSMRMTACEMG